MTILPQQLPGLAADGHQLDQLRLQAKQSPEQALRLAAKQFETVFMNMMMKSMREATPQEGMFDNEQTRMFTGMLDQQLVQNISDRGVGLADIMVRQLSRYMPEAVAPSAPPALPTGLSAPLTLLVQPVAPEVPASAEVSELTVPATPAPVTVVPSPYRGDVQQAFVDRLRPHAERASQTTGVPAHLILGQAALESGWGKREIRMPDGSNSYNLFSIKAGKNWHGKVAEVTTTEYQDGVAHKQVARFRAYDSYTEAFQDYVRLLSRNPRYENVLQQESAHGFGHALQRAGYATDPRYAEKLVGVVRRIQTTA